MDPTPLRVSPGLSPGSLRWRSAGYQLVACYRLAIHTGARGIGLRWGWSRPDNRTCSG
jgi:hypothetical protein